MMFRTTINDTNEAAEIILSTLEEKYNERFAIDGEVRILYTSEEKGYISEYVADNVYSLSDPSQVFKATCTPQGIVADDRSARIFQEDANAFIGTVFSEAGIDFLADWEVVIRLRCTVRTWNHGDSFQSYLSEADPMLLLLLYVYPDTTDEQIATQLMLCWQAVQPYSFYYEFRIGYLGDDVDRYPLFLFNSRVNQYELNDTEYIIERITANRILNELRKNDGY